MVICSWKSSSSSPQTGAVVFVGMSGYLPFAIAAATSSNERRERKASFIIAQKVVASNGGHRFIECDFGFFVP